MKALLSFTVLGTVFFLGSYFLNKANGVQLNGYLYTGIFFFIGLVIISTVLVKAKHKESNQPFNKKNRI